ncbi:MAG: MurR/RpiR family transcriptional regulator [Desulforhopalus sp.]
MKLVERIGTKYQSFTANEKRIFNLMTEDVKAFALQSIGELATSLAISKTTLMRFARTCGFSGYSDFKRALQKDVLLDVSPARKMDQVLAGDFCLSGKGILAQELQNIEATYAASGRKDLERVTEMIIEADEIHTLSWGISGNVAEIFSLRMKLMGIRCNTIVRKQGVLVEEVALLKKGDLVLVFEIPPYNNEVIEAVCALREKGCVIVIVTDSPRCPIAEYGDLVFFCATNAMFFGNSLSGSLFWVNLVSSLVIYQRKDKVIEILKERQKIFDDRKHYHQ